MTQLTAPAPASGSGIVAPSDPLIALHPTADPGRFSVDLDGAWASLVGVHGGFMSALAVHAAEHVVPGRPTRTATTTFLRTGQVGAADLDVRIDRHGGSVSTVVADLSQEGMPVLSTRVTLVSPQSGVEWNDPRPLGVPDLADCVPLDPPPGVNHFGRAEARIDPAFTPFTGGDRALVQGYVRPIDGGVVDRPWLAMVTDWFPPPAFVRIAPPTGGVSVDLTAHIHDPEPELGPDGWLVARFEIGTSTNGLAVEHGRITTQAGAVVAESFQTRWTAIR